METLAFGHVVNTPAWTFRSSTDRPQPTQRHRDTQPQPTPQPPTTQPAPAAPAAQPTDEPMVVVLPLF